MDLGDDVHGLIAPNSLMVPLEGIATHRALGPMRPPRGTFSTAAAATAAAAAEAARPLPTFAAEFELLRFIAEGKFSQICLVQSRHSDGLSVVKKELESALSIGLSLRHEIDVIHRLKSLTHPNVVCYMRAWEELSLHYIQMEYCPRGTVADYFSTVPVVPEPLCWRLLADVAAGLAAVHARAVVHLDVKPENVFVDAAGAFKIGDFGIAYIDGSGQRDSAEDGDAKYMAPELLSGAISPACDVFSLGIMAFEFAAGKELPARGELWHELRDGKVTLAHTERGTAELSGDLVELVTAMMAPDPATRPSAQAVAAFAERRVPLPLPFLPLVAL